MFHWFVVLSWFVAPVSAATNLAPGPGFEGQSSLQAAKERYDAALDEAYQKLVLALTQSAVEIEASLASGVDARGRARQDLVLVRERIQGERRALEAEGRWPIAVEVAAGQRKRVNDAKLEVLAAYRAAQMGAVSALDSKHDRQLEAGLKRYTELNLLAPHLTEPDVLARVQVGATDADWQAAGDAFVPPKHAREDGTWAPFVLGPGLPSALVADFDLVRGANEGDLLVRITDEMELDREISIPRRQVDALCRRAGVGADKPCRVRVVVTPRSAGIEIDGEDVEEIATEEAGFGLDLSRATSIAIRRGDKKGPVRVESVRVRLLPRAPTVEAGESNLTSGTDSSASSSSSADPCGGALAVTRSWSEQLGVVREARRKFEARCDDLARDLLKAFKDGIPEYMRTRVLNPNDLEQLRKAQSRIELERDRLLFAARAPTEVVSALVRTPLDNEYHKAKQELLAAFERTESALQLQSSPSELARLRDERAEIECFVDLAPWRDSNSENRFQRATSGLEELLDSTWLKQLVVSGNGLAEWNWMGVKWTSPKRPGPDGRIAPFLVKGDLPYEFVFEWSLERIEKLASDDRLRIVLTQDGVVREALVPAESLRELCTVSAAGDVGAFPLRLVVLRDRISVSIDHVRVFCASSDPVPAPEANVVKVPTELALSREGSADETAIRLVRVRAIQATSKRPPRSSEAGGDSAPEPAAVPRVATPRRVADPAPIPAPAVRPLAPSDPALGWAEVLQREADPAVVTNPSILADFALLGLPWRVRDRASGIEMLLVTPGSFSRGALDDDPAAQSNERPPHRVTLRHAFYVGRYEVQTAEWAHVMSGAPLSPDPRGLPWTGPPEQIDAFLDRTAGLRLLTEAEWEYACRAWTHEVHHADLATCAWSPSRSDGRLHEVGRLAGNGFGLHDMLGNAWEWCSDFYDPDAYVSCARGVVDPTGPASGSLRVMRGGSADPNLDDSWCRDSIRVAGELRGGATKFRGFRVARTP